MKVTRLCFLCSEVFAVIAHILREREFHSIVEDQILFWLYTASEREQGQTGGLSNIFTDPKPALGLISLTTVCDALMKWSIALCVNNGNCDTHLLAAANPDTLRNIGLSPWIKQIWIGYTKAKITDWSNLNY